MAEVSNRSHGWGWGALAAAVVLLDASLTFRNLWPTPAVRWSGELSVELAAFIGLLALATRRFGRPSRLVLRGLTTLWVVFVISRYADVTTPALYGREVNLYWDVRHVSAVAAMLSRAASWWLVILILAAVVLIPAILYAILRPALGRIATAMERPAERRVLEVLAVGLLLLYVGQQASTRLPQVFATPVTATYARQVQLVATALTAGPTKIGPPPILRPDLARIQGADVFLIFIESYGAVSFDRPSFVADLASSRAGFAADIQAAGRSVVSAFVESPTFGGNSWLAHVSLLSGVEVRDEDTNVRLMAEKRDTMVTAFAQRGYRTLAIMPGSHESWPEGSFYGFNDIYDEDRLNYRGPPFGWWSVPDQFVIARLDGLVRDGTSHAPVFAFFPTTNTHTPFSPTPPYQPDWPRVVTEKPYDDAELQQAWEQYPDWLNLGPSYVHALSYTYRTLGGYLRLRADRDFVMILIGDHQPPAVVSGEGASWEVPVHVIASRKAVLDLLVAQGFQSGLRPDHPAVTRMNALLPILLGAFSGGE